MHQINFKLSYHNGDARDGRLDMYDAAVSLRGFARALSISTHALLNDGEVRTRANKVQGARIFINPSRKGSFEELVTVVINNKEAIGASVAAAAFWDMIKWTWRTTLDLAHSPETPTVRRIAERNEPFIGEIEEALEVPLEEAHRPIKQFEDMVISVQRPRVGEIIRLDAETLGSVSLQSEANLTTGIIGNVTRYNILSGFGRFYDDNEERTVSFKVQDDVPSKQKELLTWSMDQAHRGNHGKIEMDVQRVLSAKGSVKRYLVHEIRRNPDPAVAQQKMANMR